MQSTCRNQVITPRSQGEILNSVSFCNYIFRGSYSNRWPETSFQGGLVLYQRRSKILVNFISVTLNYKPLISLTFDMVLRTSERISEKVKQ